MPQPIHIPPTKTLAELSDTLTYILNNVITTINTEKPNHDQDFNGHRITNLGSPTRSSDAVTVAYLERQLGKQFSSLKNSTIRYVNSQLSTGTQMIVGTHSERTTNYDPLAVEQGSIFYETDRTTLYQVQAAEWRVVQGSGPYRETLVNIPVDLGATDEGFLFYSTDYDHTWRWTGSVWTWAPGERKPKEFALFPASPGTGWALCDGSSVTITQTDATTTSFLTPNASGNYLKVGAYTGTPDSAIAPTLSGSTDAASAGTPAGSVSSSFTGSGGGTTGTPSATQSVQSGVGATVPTGTHTHSGGVPTGTVASSFTGSALASHSHPLTGVTVSDTAEPAHLVIALYIRL